MIDLNNANNSFLVSGCTETQSQLFFDIAKPVFIIEDIALSLSHMCRWGGHCSKFYSVAEHSLMVSQLMETLGLGDPLEGLLHDATEAYFSDVISTYKPLLPDWRKIDKALDLQLRGYFRLPAGKTPGCHKADTLALYIEAGELLPSRGYGPAWPKNEPLREEAQELISRGWRLSIRDMETTRLDFLTNFRGMYELRLDQRGI